MEQFNPTGKDGVSAEEFHASQAERHRKMVEGRPVDFMDQIEKDGDIFMKGYAHVLDKKIKYGVVSLTAQDHKLMGSSPDSRLTGTTDLQLYEVMSSEEIESYLDNSLDDYKKFKKGEESQNIFTELSSQEFLPTFNYLKEKNLLPAKYEDFDIKSIEE